MCKILPRIKQIALNEGITIGALERCIGASKGVLSRAITNGTDIQAKWIEAVVENYPQYSTQWLLTGEGEMLKSKQLGTETTTYQASVAYSKDKIDTVDRQSLDQNYTGEMRPRIPLTAAAGSLSIALDSVRESECEMIPIIPTFPKYDFTIVAHGDSMTPDILSGDELACRFINDKGFIQWGRTHVLDTAQGIIVKRIFDANNNIVCRSSNPNYPDFPVSKTEIYHLALVVGLVRQV